jgi:hypothetical protein
VYGRHQHESSVWAAWLNRPADGGSSRSAS